MAKQEKGRKMVRRGRREERKIIEEVLNKNSKKKDIGEDNE